MLEAHVVSACPAMEQPVSEGFETYCGLLRLYDGFAAEEDSSVPEFEYDHAHPDSASFAIAIDSTMSPETVTR